MPPPNRTPFLACCVNRAGSDERIRPVDDGDGDKEGEKRKAPTESLIQQELKKQKVRQDKPFYGEPGF